MNDNPPTVIHSPPCSPDGLVRNGLRRGIPASAESDNSPLSIAVKMNARRLSEDYPSKLLPLYERLRRHLFSVTTLCNVLTKSNDIKDAEHEFSQNRSLPQYDVLPHVDIDESRSDDHEDFQRYWESLSPTKRKDKVEKLDLYIINISEMNDSQVGLLMSECDIHSHADFEKYWQDLSSDDQIEMAKKFHLYTTNLSEMNDEYMNILIEDKRSHKSS